MYVFVHVYTRACAYGVAVVYVAMCVYTCVRVCVCVSLCVYACARGPRLRPRWVNFSSKHGTSRPNGLTFSWWGCYGLCPRQKPTELAHSFYSALVSVSVSMALSTVFYSINSPDNSPLSHSVLLVFSCLTCPFIYVSLCENLPQP